ncbi:uncharacterized protein LOC141899867 [Tubulanus polymorphus]|uniref:uncharacterized protein LOC141899867 n=1 Tax=Tubulanus polymorphus TaxID=672921 RepID=UPI003DA2D1A2
MAAPISVDDDEIVLHRNKNCNATIRRYGATVISWVSAGKQRLFLSEEAHLKNNKAIRGGIPLVFPNFGPWKLGPQHGFARIKMWNLETDPVKESNGDLKAVFSLEDDEETRKMWNYRFKLEYTVVLQEKSLLTSLKIINRSASFFDFTCLLHTYLLVPEVTDTVVSGLKGLKYIDKVKYSEECEEDRTEVVVNEHTDRIYIDSRGEHEIRYAENGKQTIVNLSKSNLPDTVLWNPWNEKAKQMSDFGDDEYRIMLCVEAGRVNQPIALAAGQEYLVSQKLTLKEH